MIYVECFRCIHNVVYREVLHAQRDLCDSVAQRLGRRTSDQAVVGSIPGQADIGLPRSTQPSIPPG